LQLSPVPSTGFRSQLAERRAEEGGEGRPRGTCGEERTDRKVQSGVACAEESIAVPVQSGAAGVPEQRLVSPTTDDTRGEGGKLARSA
jgi:hypothetical protein